MALTKVSGGILDPGINVAGIVTATGFDGPFTGGSSKNITAGIITATGFDLNGNGDISGNLVVGGNLTANGDFTTLNTTLREVELLRVDANSSAIAGIITQSGSGYGFYVDGTTVLGNTQLLPSLGTGTKAVVANLSGNNNWIDLTIFGGRTGRSILNFGDHDDQDAGAIKYYHNDNSLNFTTNGSATERLTIHTGGNVGINSTIPTAKLDVNGHTELDNVNIAGVSTHNEGIFLPDGKIAKFGNTAASPNLEIFNNSSLSRIRHNDAARPLTISNTGNNDIYTDSRNLFLRVAYNGSNSPENAVVATANGAVDLYHDGLKTAFTDVDTWKVHGRTSNSGMVEIASNQGSNNNDRFRIHKTSAASRLTIQAYSTGSWVENIRITAGGAVELKHADGTTHFETTANGAAVSNIANNHGLDLNGVGNNTCIRFMSTSSSPTHAYRIAYHSVNNNIFNSPCLLFNKTSTNGTFDSHIAAISDTGFHLADNKKLHVGGTTNASSANGDLQIYHDTNNSFITNTTGNLTVTNSGTNYTYVDSNFFRVRNHLGSHMFDVNSGGSHQGVGLYYSAGSQGTEKLRTSATGITVNGEVAASQDYPNFRPTLDFNFAASKKLDPRITYSRSGSASFLNEFGKVVLVGDNVPRFDHDLTTRECKGLLIEESRTNQITGSFDLTVSGYSLTNVDITPSTTETLAPSGDFTASKMVVTTTAQQHYINFSNMTKANGAERQCVSFWAKLTSSNYPILKSYITGAGAFNNYSEARFNLSTGVVTAHGYGGYTNHSAKMTQYPNGWYKCEYEATLNSSETTKRFQLLANNGSSDAGNGTDGYYIWGVQVEVGDFATSLIPTNGITETRGQDLVEITEEEFSEFYNRTEGSFVSEIMLKPSFPVTGYASIMMTLSDGSYDNRVTLSSSTGSAAFNADVNVGGSLSRASLGSYISGSHSIKAAMAYKQADTAGSLNGAAAVTTSPSGTLPLLTRADIGKDHGNHNPLNGHVKRIMYYSKRLPNDQLVTLTS